MGRLRDNPPRIETHIQQFCKLAHRARNMRTVFSRFSVIGSLTNPENYSRNTGGIVSSRVVMPRVLCFAPCANKNKPDLVFTSFAALSQTETGFDAKVLHHELFWSTGDGGPQTDPYEASQTDTNLHGSMIRILVPAEKSDQKYKSPTGNLKGR